MRRRRSLHLVKALATDGDGTLMRGKLIARETARALERWRMSGRKLVLVTGENQEQLKEFPDVQAFDLIVAENGAILYWPLSRSAKRLADKCPPRLLKRLQSRRVSPLKCGEVMISTHAKHANVLEEELRRLNLNWQLIRNRDQVMALPEGIDKSTGLCAGLDLLGLKREHVLGAGDAENDVALLACCGVGVAVNSAVPELKRHADIIANHGPGRAIVELIDEVLRHETR